MIHLFKSRRQLDEMAEKLVSRDRRSTPSARGLSYLREVNVRTLLAVLTACLIVEGTIPLRAQQGGTVAPVSKLQIVIIEGDGAVNNIKLRTGREVIVQVEDENHRPVAGAALSAFLPDNGASGTFTGGGQTFYGTSAGNGQVKFSFRPNKVQGKFQIRLNASFQGQSVTGAVAETNIVSIAAAGAGLSLAAKILIIVAVGVSAGAGAGVALAHGGGSSSPNSSSTPSAITIGAGTGPVVIGPPH
ncbi:MAG TPA: hypothetical protein VKV15_27375 [Bryobacteraceae bacterium]|nr:hypothetical protein [Bryobacteraceae bacterium]